MDSSRLSGELPRIVSRRDGLLTRLVAGDDPLTFFCAGKCEGIKAVVHTAMLGLLATCTVYNAAAWALRRDRYLARNVVLYGAGAWWEWRAAQKHWACRK